MSLLTQFYNSGGGAGGGSGSGGVGYPLDGPFGTGVIEVIPRTTTWTVPPNITTIRVRCWGAGATSAAAGESSSFGSFCTAGGGGSGGGGLKEGGVASGGDVNSNGGSAPAAFFGGGGGAGNLFGNAGKGGDRNGEGGVSSVPFGTPGRAGIVFETRSPAAAAPTNAAGAPFGLFSIDLIGTGSGGGGGEEEGLGETTLLGGDGFNGGGGGLNFGGGGFPGGAFSNCGAGAFVLKTITGLTPGASYPVTVGKVPTTFGTTRSGAGLVIIEY